MDQKNIYPHATLDNRILLRVKGWVVVVVVVSSILIKSSADLRQEFALSVTPEFLRLTNELPGLPLGTASSYI